MTETHDELDLIAGLRDDAPAGAPMTVRARVLRHVMQPRRRRRTPLLVAAAASLAIAATATWALGPGAGPSAAAVLGHAAEVVAAAPTPPPPTSHQWVRSGNAFGPNSSGTINYVWTRFDGALTAMGPLAGPVHVQKSSTPTGQGGSPMDWYRLLSGLPEQPDAVLRTLSRNPLYTSRGRTQADRDFDEVTQALGKQTAISPINRARLYTALGAIPGVGVNEHAAPDGLGRRILSITYTGQLQSARRADHWEVLLDPKTYAWNGLRGTAGEDFTPQGGQPISKGTVWYEDDRIPNQIVNQPPPSTSESIKQGSDCEKSQVCRDFVESSKNPARKAGSDPSGS